MFKSNVPRYFGEDEVAGYVGFLKELPCVYLVVEFVGMVVGAGGYYCRADDDCAGLAWGLVAREYQRKGIGTALLRERLRRLAKEPGIRWVRVKTSQYSEGFFQQFDFRTERVVEDRFAPGLHEHEMVL